MNSSELEEQRNQWLQEEEDIKKRIVLIEDSIEDSILEYPLKIGGADISFFENEPNKAVCCYVILEYESEDQKSPKILKNDCQIVELRKFILNMSDIKDCIEGSFEALDS